MFPGIGGKRKTRASSDRFPRPSPDNQIQIQVSNEEKLYPSHKRQVLNTETEESPAGEFEDLEDEPSEEASDRSQQEALVTDFDYLARQEVEGSV